jgi:hypothetical protein
MGILNIFVCVALFASFLFINTHGKVLPVPSDNQPSSNELQKRPIAWIKAYPIQIRRSKPLSVPNLSPNDLEFVDETDDGIRKRYGRWSCDFKY